MKTEKRCTTLWMKHTSIDTVGDKAPTNKMSETLSSILENEFEKFTANVKFSLGNAHYLPSEACEYHSGNFPPETIVTNL